MELLGKYNAADDSYLCSSTQIYTRVGKEFFNPCVNWGFLSVRVFLSDYVNDVGDSSKVVEFTEDRIIIEFISSSASQPIIVAMEKIGDNNVQIIPYGSEPE